MFIQGLGFRVWGLGMSWAAPGVDLGMCLRLSGLLQGDFAHCSTSGNKPLIGSVLA